MASRAELVAICKELNINCEDMAIEEMDEIVRKEIDKQFNISIMIGNIGKSETLLRFMEEEYDYKFYNEDNEEVDYKGRKK